MDTITVRIPAQPQYLHIARLISAGLAARLGFTIDDIEDLKIAVDELAAYMTGAGGRDGTLAFEFDVYKDRIEIRGVGHFTSDVEVRTDLTEFSRMILDTVTDQASLEHADGMPTFKLVKSKAK
jgi:anti-sigma regulatory factor (Ser/Thr protein kinase)